VDRKEQALTQLPPYLAERADMADYMFLADENITQTLKACIVIFI
jgi:hypothetical protein